jgi:uncharacterized protein (DUF1501 family)
MISLTRRKWIQGLCAGVALYRVPFARAEGHATTPTRAKSLIIVFQRGAADGLSMVPPVFDKRYYAYRPGIAVAPPGHGDDAALPLDATFGLHPALAPLHKLYLAGKLALVHAVGSPDATRSHFDAQDYVESGTPGVKGTDDGWLARLLSAKPVAAPNPLRAVALQPTLPRILSGSANALAVNALSDFKVQARGVAGVSAHDFEHMYAGAVDQALRGTAAEAFDAMGQLQKLAGEPPANGALYPSSPLGKRLLQIAQLIRSDLGVEVAVTECGGWDTHAGQGDAKGQLASRLSDLADSMSAFAVDLGPRLADVCLVTVTEFGRTVRENGTRGTDHGHGGVMMVLGGKVRGRKVYGKWRGLAPEALWEGRDLPVTTDHRQVFGEVLRSHWGVKDLGAVFPEYVDSPAARLGLFG